MEKIIEIPRSIAKFINFSDGTSYYIYEKWDKRINKFQAISYALFKKGVDELL